MYICFDIDFRFEELDTCFCHNILAIVQDHFN